MFLILIGIYLKLTKSLKKNSLPYFAALAAAEYPPSPPSPPYAPVPPCPSVQYGQGRTRQNIVKTELFNMK